MKSLLVSLAIATMLIGGAVAQSQVSVTPATGESWISHLHRPLEETSMGRTGLLGPATFLPTPVAEKSSTSIRRLAYSARKQSATLQGADLYRLNCRGCHGESGLGAAPEISSVIDATRATYAPFTLDRLRRLGMETTRTEANELANQAKGALLERLHHGGVDMPPFPQLSEPEARAIFAYLRQLAEIPGAGSQQLHLEERPLRIGEHIVKSTCHICHNATGVNPSPEELMHGAIPPLSSLTSRVSLREFEQKVQHGAPIMMGTPLLPYRGRMPVFNYLSESEVADAYLYLKLYPPSAWTDPATSPDRVQPASVAVASDSEPPNATPRGVGPAPRQASARKTRIIPVIAGVIVALLIAGGTIFTFYEVKRSRPRRRRLPGMGAAGFAIASPESLGKTRPVPEDPHKQAAWHSRLHRSEHDLFESSWFSRQLENKDGAA